MQYGYLSFLSGGCGPCHFSSQTASFLLSTACPLTAHSSQFPSLITHRIQMEGSKFVGGSALAKKRARQTKFKPPVNNNKPKMNAHSTRKPHSLRLPNKVSPSDRFFASLLLTSVHDLISSNSNDRWPIVVGDMCNRAGLPFPAKLNMTDQDAHQFFGMRGSLVLEEARSVLAEELSNRQRNRRAASASGGGLNNVTLVSVEHKKNGFMGLTFGKNKKNGDSQPFAPSELYDMKPGNVVEVAFRDGAGQRRSILTNIIPMPKIDDRTISLMAYRMEEVGEYLNDDATTFQLIPVTTLISEQRQFVACFSMPKVFFLPKLMGMKSSTHTRFDDSDDDDDDDHDDSCDENEVKYNSSSTEVRAQHGIYVDHENDGEEKKLDDDDEHMIGSNEDRVPTSSIDIPTLNVTQEKAASSFINGPSDNLSLVQGPPGTGKTTFMVAVLCRTFLRGYSADKEYCTIDLQKRVLVAAPTNKAISVLASRFLRATNGYIGLNVILIGVEDALFPKDELGHDADETLSSLKSVFVYSWVDELIKDFQTLKVSRDGVPSLQDIEEVLHCAKFLVQKMERGIPQLAEKCGSLRLGKSFVNLLVELPSKIIDEEGAITRVLGHVIEVDDTLGRLVSCLVKMDSAVEELMATANVIFSTLTSSGVSIMKRTRGIHGESNSASSIWIFLTLYH